MALYLTHNGYVAHILVCALLTQCFWTDTIAGDGSQLAEHLGIVLLSPTSSATSRRCLVGFASPSLSVMGIGLLDLRIKIPAVPAEIPRYAFDILGDMFDNVA